MFQLKQNRQFFRSCNKGRLFGWLGRMGLPRCFAENGVGCYRSQVPLVYLLAKLQAKLQRDHSDGPWVTAFLTPLHYPVTIWELSLFHSCRKSGTFSPFLTFLIAVHLLRCSTPGTKICFWCDGEWERSFLNVFEQDFVFIGPSF